MMILTNQSELIEIGIKYLKIAGWSYLMTGISQCYLTILKVSEHASVAARISSGAVVINIILNAIFIYGKFGLKPMGVQGAALGTLIGTAGTEDVAAAYAATYPIALIAVVLVSQFLIIFFS